MLDEPCVGEHCDHLRVVDLAEVAIELPDGPERLGGVEADDLIGFRR